MKKILIITIILLICGCKPSDIPDNTPIFPPVDEEIQSVITREQVLKNEAVKIYGDFEINKDNIGSYGTPLKTIIGSIEHKELFDNCDTDKTIISFHIFEEEGTISSKLKLILKCDHVTKNYSYHNVNDDEPYEYFEY